MQLLPASLGSAVSSGEIHLLVEVRMHNPTLVAVLWAVGVLIVKPFIVNQDKGLKCLALTNYYDH